MLGLVDYGSDSDSDSGSPPPPPAKSLSATLPAPKTNGLSLPPPTASSSALNLPPLSNSLTAAPAPKAPPKKAKGPVRIMLDLPPPTSSNSSTATQDEPPAKKPKLTLGGSGKLSGLAAMLPAPKNEAPPPKAAPPPVASASARPSAPEGMEGLDSLLGELEGKGKEEVKGGGMFVPHSMKAKKAPTGTTTAAKAAPAPVADAGLDFFGLGSVASTSSAPSIPAKSHLPSISSAPSLSSAPPPATSTSSTSAEDPYPGFTQLPNGQWVANNQETYDLWVSQVGVDGQGGGSVPDEEVPRGFGANAVANAVDLDGEAARRREAWEKRPEVLGADGKPTGKEGAGEEEKKGFQIAGQKKVGQQRARRTGQLSGLLADAVDRRAELEERIARGKANKKASGNKYGF